MLNLKSQIVSESSDWESIGPGAAVQAVAVLIPLSTVRWDYREDGHPKLFETYRTQSERVVSYIAFSIQESGLALSYDCRANKDRLVLIMIGSDRERLRNELLTYLQLLKLPADSTMAVFAGGASPPEEINLT
jgi:hypothetical protein